MSKGFHVRRADYGINVALFIALVLTVSAMLYSVYINTRPVKDGPIACWTETKADGTEEQISGNVKLAPKGAHNFADTCTQKTTIKGELI